MILRISLSRMSDLNAEPSVISVTAMAGTRRNFFLVCPNALAAGVGCGVLVERWFRPNFFVCAQFGVGAWSAEVPVCWIDYPDRFRHFLCQSVQDAWQIHLDVLRPVPVDAGLPC